MKDEVFKFSAPLRLSLAGGGTDLPENYLKSGARVMSVSLNERITIKVGKEIKNEPSPLVDLFRTKHPEYQVQVSSNIPVGSGLGGSGSLSVALVAADNYLSIGSIGEPLQIGMEAYLWEREILQQPVGFQDQLVAALGGCVEMNASITGEVTAKRREDLLKRLYLFMENNFILIETGIHRDANVILKQLALSYAKKSELGPATFEDVENVILNENIEKFGLLVQNHWYAKRQRLPESTTQEIDYIIQNAMEAGAIGAKTIGAGGGGYILLCVKTGNKLPVIQRMKSIGCVVAEISLSSEGVRLE